jgi:hypothetical protein
LNSALTQALVIAAIGLPLLFLSLGLFYVVLSLIARIQDKRVAEPHPAVTGSAGLEADLAAQRAAAIAVALARAAAEQAPSRGEATRAIETRQEGASTWWTIRHQRQLGRQPQSRRGT